MASNKLKSTCLSALSIALLATPITWASDVKAPVNDADVVLVKNSLTTVTKADFYTELRRLPEEYRGGVELSDENIVKKIDGILLNKSLAAQARQQKIDSEPEVRQAFAWMMEKGLAQMVMERLVRKAEADFEKKKADFEPRAKEIYKINPEKYSEQAAVTASHVLISLDKYKETKGKEVKDKEAEALKLAQEVRKLALEGKPFDELALKYSDDPSAKMNKGDMGSFTTGRMLKPFEDAAFALAKPGDISEPVKTQYGYHVIRLHEKKPARLKPFEDVKNTIMAELQAEYVGRIRAEHVAKINSDKTTFVNKEAIASLKKKAPDKAKLDAILK